MSEPIPRLSPSVLPATLCMAALLLAGCGTVNRATANIAGLVTPYKVDVVQGNFIAREQVEALRPGMGRNQVRELLGTPLLTSVFHGDRWDYVFTFKRQGLEPQARKLVVFFKGDTLERFEGDPMPTEAEFVSMLDSGRRTGKAPVLEASEDALKKFAPQVKPNPAAAAPDAAATPALPANYPPLEAPAR